MSERGEFLDDVRETLDARREEYGDAEKSFREIAARWSAHIGMDVTVEQVVACMMELKMVRLSGCPGHRDSIIDVAGYATLLDELSSLDRKVEPARHPPETSASITLAMAAKILGFTVKDFIEYLCNIRWVYRRGGNGAPVAYKGRVSAGCIEERKIDELLHDRWGTLCEQPMITPKGMAVLRSLRETEI